jgi:hypothetical protein
MKSTETAYLPLWRSNYSSTSRRWSSRPKLERWYQGVLQSLYSSSLAKTISWIPGGGFGAQLAVGIRRLHADACSYSIKVASTLAFHFTDVNS